jgi:UV DNA damage repair endonuclease
MRFGCAGRLSFHASHFTILNSLNPKVAGCSVADLPCYSRVFQGLADLKCGSIVSRAGERGG